MGGISATGGEVVGKGKWAIKDETSMWEGGRGEYEKGLA